MLRQLDARSVKPMISDLGRSPAPSAGREFDPFSRALDRQSSSGTTIVVFSSGEDQSVRLSRQKDTLSTLHYRFGRLIP
jgi:hypothetical protein